jgi:hypothetical protein
VGSDDRGLDQEEARGSKDGYGEWEVRRGDEGRVEQEEYDGPMPLALPEGWVRPENPLKDLVGRIRE